MASYIQGTLILRGGCLRVVAARSDYLILWPAEATVQGDGSSLQIGAGDGRMVGRVGETIVLGGGELPGVTTLGTPERAMLRATSLVDCPGPYWRAHFIEPRLIPTIVAPKSH